jgi:hypothetical protein
MSALAALGLAAVAGAAQAQPLDLRLPEGALPPLAAAPRLGQPARAVPDLANPLDPLARPALQPGAVETAVFARTAVERRVAGRDNLTGSLGFLCGLQPGHNDAGGAAAYGVDPHGRFVGTKFSLAFR